MKVLFRFEASPQVGLGHKSRCLALAGCLHHTAGFHGVVAARSETAASPMLDFVKLQKTDDEPDEFRDLVLREKPDLVITDSYSLKPEWFQSTAQAGAPVLRISDSPSPTAGCTYLLDQSPAHGATDYAAAPDCELMVGARWALLDQRFFNLRHRPRSSTGNRVLISMGSGRVGAATTSRVLRNLRDVEDQLDVTVIEADPTARRRAESIAHTLHHTVRLIPSTSEMARLAFEHDLAVGSGGVAALERCVVGLPSAIIPVAGNQEPNVRALVGSGAATACEPDNMAETLEILRSRAPATALAAAALCDGLGALRCAQRLGARPPVELRPATSSDEDKALAFGQQTIAGIREHSRTPSAPTWQEHSSWYDDTIARTERRLYFIAVADFLVGQIRVDQMPDEGGEVSILLVPEARGLSLASDAIRQLTRQTDQTLSAYIAPANEPSIAAFRAAGFAPIGSDRYEYRADE